MRVRAKICGVTNPEDALGAIDAGADALGFNLWPGSKRHIPLDEHASWIVALPPFVTRVAVLVNAPLEEARRVAEHPAIDIVQFHGDESLGYLSEFAALGRPFVIALRLGDSMRPVAQLKALTSNLLIDAAVPWAYGGTGHSIDLAVARSFVAEHREIRVTLAGGLTPENVDAAARAVGPYAVDVASGVEVSPRQKAVAKMRSFIAALRS
jgi:phosphoribosylanthranilate isomerase